MRPPPRAPAPGTPQRTAWGAVLVFVAGGVLAAVHLGKLPPALPLMRAELGFGLVAAGFVVALFNLLAMTVSVLFGGLVDRIGRPRLVQAGFACLLAGGVIGALAQGLPVLMLSRLLEGFGFVAISVSLPVLIMAASAARDQGFTLALWSVYTPLGMALVMLAAPLALDGAGWRGLWWAVAALTPFCALAVWWQMARFAPAPSGGRAPDPAAPPRPLTLVREALATRGLQVIALLFGLYAFQWVTLMVWLPSFQTESLGADLRQAALVTALVVLANVPGCLLGGWLLRHGASARQLVVTGSAVMGACAVLIFLPLLPDPARLGLSVVFSFTGGLIPPSLFNTVPRAASGPHHISVGNGMLMQGSALGQFTGAPLVALAVSLGGGDWRFAVIPMLAASLGALAAALACLGAAHR